MAITLALLLPSVGWRYVANVYSEASSSIWCLMAAKYRASAQAKFFLYHLCSQRPPDVIQEITNDQ